MTRLALYAIVGLSVASVAAAQKPDQEFPFSRDTLMTYGVPKELLNISELAHCQKLEVRWPMIRPAPTATIQTQKCFRGAEREDRITIIYFLNFQKKFIAPIGFVFEHVQDLSAPIGKLKYSGAWLLANEGVEERGEATKQWRVREVPNDDLMAYLAPKIGGVFESLCAHYKLRCLLRNRK